MATGNLRLLANPDLRATLVRYYEELERDEEIILRNNEAFTDGLTIPPASVNGPGSGPGRSRAGATVAGEPVQRVPGAELERPGLGPVLHDARP